MTDLKTRIRESADAIRILWRNTPAVGLVLGSGLSELVSHITPEAVVPTRDIPHFSQPTAIGHQGRLICGQLAGIPIVALAGRLHGYEGHSFQSIAFPVRVMAALGIRLLVLTNAAGAVNPLYRRGDIMLIEDHINLMGENPLRGPNDESIGPRFVDLSAAYDRELLMHAEQACERIGQPTHRGVYVGLLGPNYETPAEYRMVRSLGGDVVGMSTIPEVLAARHAGLRVLALSVVSNVYEPDNIHPTDAHAVIDTVASVAGRVLQIVCGVLERQRAELCPSIS